MSREDVKNMYLVIQTRYEGIETLCHLTSSSSEAAEKKKEFAQKVFNQEQELYDELKRNGRGPNPDLQEILDMFCIQQWDEKKFKCVCTELGLSPRHGMFR